MVSGFSVEPFRNLYPFESRYLNLGSHRLHYLDEGQGDPLVMLHGNPTWSFYYRNLIKGLKSQCRCVVPDHMGCGLSDKPQDYPYTLSQHIDNLEALIDDLGLENLTLVVHDWGGAIGMGYAVRHPEKIKRLVLFNTAAFITDRIPFSINLCRNSIIGPLAILKFNLFAKMAITWASKVPGRMTRRVRKGYLAPYHSPESRIAHLRFVQDIPMSPDIASYGVVEEIESHLGYFRDMPMMIIWGMKDFCFNEYFLERWKKIFPQAEVREVPQAGHYVVEDADEEIIPWMIEFLKTNPL